MKKDVKEFKEYIDIYVEIDTEKRVVCISDKTLNGASGVAKRYRNKKDINRIFSNYLFREVSLYPPKNERKK